MTTLELQNVASKFIDKTYPTEVWIRVYTDGAAEEAVRNGGGGVVIEWRDGTTLERSIPTGKHSTNYRAEAAALEEAAAILHNSDIYDGNIVFLSDAKSVLQALQNPKNRQHNQLKSSLQQLGQSAKQIILQWLPSHCNLSGNEKADHLAKEGTTLEQLDDGCSHEEKKKTHITAASRRRWKSAHPNYNPDDPIHTLPRKQQTIVFRLRTGHNSLNQHMYRKFKVGKSELCTCGQAAQDTKHVLESCTLLEELRTKIWPKQTTLTQKLYGTACDLCRTTDFIEASGLFI